MKTIKFTMEMDKLAGFDEQIFLGVIQKNLSSVNAKALRYARIDNGYRFEVDTVLK